MRAQFESALPGACLAVFVFFTGAQADPLQWKAEGWKTDFEKTTEKLDRVLSGGPPRDGIPSIDNPKFVEAAGHSGLADNEPVIGLSISGDARAYPLRVLTWHEIVNDTVGGIPVAVTYCPLCNSSLVFERSVDGETLEFGTTGKLKDSNLIMYDRRSESWWQQFSGEAIAGIHAGEKLTLLPSRLQSWAQFKADHPGGEVLVPNDPELRDYGRNPYVGYDSGRPFLYDGQLPPGIDPMQRVVVVRRGDGDPIVVTMNLVRDSGPIERGGHVIAWEAGQSSALDAPEIARGRDIGTISVHKGGRDVAYDVTFAFVAHAFYPQAEIATQ
jgi:hypothetical protein